MDYIKKIENEYLSRHFEDVLKLCDEAIKRFPDNAVFYYFRGLCNQRFDKHEDAIEDFDNAIRLNPGNGWYYYKRADSKYEFGRYTEALDDVTTSIEMSSEDDLDEDVFLLCGDIFRALERYELAEANYLKAIEIAPGCAYSYFKMADLKELLEAYDSAIEYYDKAISLEPYDYFNYYAKSYTCKELKDYQGAIQLLSHAILLAPEEFRPYEKRAEIYTEQKRYKEALKDYNKLISLVPNNSEYYNYRADVFLYMEQYQEAIEDYNIAIMLSEEPDANLFNSRGTAKGKLEQYESAIQDFEQALKIKPDNFLTMENLGVAYYRQNKYKEALKYFNLACKYDKKSHEIYYFKGLSNKMLGNFESAQKDYQTALQLQPDYELAQKELEDVRQKLSKKEQPLWVNLKKTQTPAKIQPKSKEQAEEKQCCPVGIVTDTKKLNEHLESARSCLLNGQALQAMVQCREALKIDPKNAVAYCRLGVAYFLHNEYSEALEYYRKAIDLNPDYAVAYCNIGVLKEKCGDYSDAARYYDRALKCNPNLQEAKTYKQNLCRPKHCKYRFGCDGEE